MIKFTRNKKRGFECVYCERMVILLNILSIYDKFLYKKKKEEKIIVKLLNPP